MTIQRPSSIEVDVAHRGRELLDLDRHDRLERGERVVLPLVVVDQQLVVEGRIPQRRLEEEAVELRLGERERPLVLDRVLGREEQERPGRRRVRPSVVTCCSAIASSSAAWVLGIARLISSTSTTFAKIGLRAGTRTP